MENNRLCEESSEYDDLELFEGDSLPLEDLLWKKVNVIESRNQDIPFFLADLGEIYRKLEDWKTHLPRVEPFFAVKCNSHPVIPKFLADSGVSFDCASKKELELILNLGVHPSRIIYSNPFKQISYLTYAANNNVDLTVFDDVHELVKIKEHFPSARLLLRMTTRTEVKVIHSFNNKFGCPFKNCEKLLTQAKAMKLNVVGICFHVGSQPDKADCFSYAIEDAYSMFKVGRALGFNMDVLDIGGGFPGHELGDTTFAEIAEAVNKSLDQYFPASEGVRVIAEPGRFFVTTAVTLAVCVIAKKIVDQADCVAGDEQYTLYSENSSTYLNHTSKNNGIVKDRNVFMENGSPATKEDSLLHMYVMNQGIHGIFANVIKDKAPTSLKLLQKVNETKEEQTHLRRSRIFGPTCAGDDCLISECKLPEIHVGQWFYFCNMGAYSFSLASGFNGFELPILFPVCSTHYWNKVYHLTN